MQCPQTLSLVKNLVKGLVVRDYVQTIYRIALADRNFPELRVKLDSYFHDQSNLQRVSPIQYCGACIAMAWACPLQITFEP